MNGRSLLIPAHLNKTVSQQSDAEMLDFELLPSLEAGSPPEARGLARDEVRLMVSYRSDDRIVHTRFRQLGDFLDAGDLIVINTSGTMNAALNALREDNTPLELHLSTHLPANLWTVEVRAQYGKTTKPLYDIRAGERLRLEGGGEVILHTPYAISEQGDYKGNQGNHKGLPLRSEAGWKGKQGDHKGSPLPSEAGWKEKQGARKGAPLPSTRHRLWIATLNLPDPLQEYLTRYGFPIRYSYVQEQWPLSYYQTVYATEMGSAEMPSAGRAFTAELITQLVAHGIQVAPLLLHTGVASLEEHEPPYEEWYRVSPETARIVNATRASGKRVVAVGTTVIRALETVTDATGTTHPGEGWTQLVVTPDRGVRALNGLLTGFHEPHATHLWMLGALAGYSHLKHTYAEALREGYLWHEFGDLHLILP